MNSGLLAIGLTTLDINAYPIDGLTHTERAILIQGLVCAPAGTAAGAALGSQIRIGGRQDAPRDGHEMRSKTN